MSYFIDFLVSVNKIAVIAFVAVVGLLVYEILQVIRERQKKIKPVLPQLSINEGKKEKSQIYAVIRKEKETRNHNTNILVILGCLSLLLILTGYFIVRSSQLHIKKEVNQKQYTVVEEVSSDGVRVFTLDWKEIGKETKMIIRPGDRIIIGIQTIQEADIDRARIRVNSKEWQIKDITSQFNKNLMVFYKEYSVATGESQLKIDAQLHSANDGWLGE